MHNRRTRASKTLWEHHYATFRRRLVDARKLAGLSQADAAERLGKTRVYVSKCETGERRVDVVELANFAHIYQQPITFFTPVITGLR